MNAPHPIAGALPASSPAALSPSAGGRSPFPTRIKRDRFGDEWHVYTGSEARRIRREVKAEAEAALARYDAEPTPENRAAFAALADTERVVGDRLAAAFEQHMKQFRTRHGLRSGR